MNKEIRFEFQTDRLEVYKSDDGKPHIRSVASDSLEDRQGDVITEMCIKQMATQVSKNEIPLLPDHRASFEIGKSSQGDTRRNPETKGLELVADFELDDRYTEATVLFNEVQSNRCKRQLSIGGFLNKNNPRAAYMENRDGKILMVLDDIILDHIAVTREGKAANPRTNFVDAIVKSIDDAGFDVTEAGLVERPESADEEKSSDIVGIPTAVQKLDTKHVGVWRSVWKDTFVRQMHIGHQSVEQAEASAAGVATAVLSKKLGVKLEVSPDEYAVLRKEQETFVIGTTRSKKGHTHLWVAREVGEKIHDGMMLTVKGHSHNILETGECDRDGDHHHTMVRKDRKVAEPSTELSAPVGLLYFGKGYGSEEDVRLWLDANGIDPLSITRVADSTFTVEFSLAPFTVDTEQPAEEGAEMTKQVQSQMPDVEKATVPYKAWPMSDERGWSWTAQDGNDVLGENNWSRYKAAHTYYDESRGATPEIKGSYSLPHHKMSDGGLKTYAGGVIAATAIMNGARGGFRRETSEEGRRSLYNHLRKHYAQAGRTAPPMKTKWMERTKDDFVHPNPKTLAERDFEDFVFSLEQCGFKEEIPEFITKEWWLTWDEEATGLAEIPETEKGIWVEIEKATVEDDDATETPVEAGEQASEAATTKDEDGRTGDDKPTESAKEEVAKSEDSDTMTKKLEEMIAGLATATQKAISDLASTVSEISTRIDGLEKTDPPANGETPVETKTEETPSDKKVDEKPAEKAEEPPTEKPAETSAAPAAPTEKETSSKQTDKETISSEDKSSEDTPVHTPATIFGAFHALLESMGMTAKEFTEAMAQKSLDSMGPSLTGAVEKTVKESISSLQKGVKAEVEKAVVGQIDVKLQEVAKDFRETIEKLDLRLEKVEQVGGVPKGASGQEGTSEAADKPQGTFTGMFAGALRRSRR